MADQIMKMRREMIPVTSGIISLLIAFQCLAEPDLRPPIDIGTSANGLINSPFGPRNPCKEPSYVCPGPETKGGASKIHKGVDYNLEQGDKDSGILIDAFARGTITDISIKPPPNKSDTGHKISIELEGPEPRDVINLWHTFSPFPLAHWGPVPLNPGDYKARGRVSLDASYDFTLVLTELEGKRASNDSTTAKCPYILFLDSAETTVLHAYTQSGCPHLAADTPDYKVIYKTLKGSLEISARTAKVDPAKFPFIAAIGTSGAAFDAGAHLHVGLNNCKTNKCKNPLTRIVHDSASALSYDIKAGDISPADTRMTVRIGFAPHLDLNSVKILLPEALGGGTKEWNIGGKNAISGNISESQLVTRGPGGCQDSSLTITSDNRPQICAEPWEVTNVSTSAGQQKVLTFLQPITRSAAKQCSYEIEVTTGSITQSLMPTRKVLAKYISYPPVAVNDTATTRPSTELTIDVKANDSDQDTLKSQLIVTDLTVVGGASKGSASVNPDGTITFTPATGVFGDVVVLYTLRDECGVSSEPASVVVSVGFGPHRFEFKDQFTDSGSCRHFLASSGASAFGWSSYLTDFDFCERAVVPVVACVGSGCRLFDRFHISTVGFEQTAINQIFPVPGGTGVSNCLPSVVSFYDTRRFHGVSETYIRGGSCPGSDCSGWFPIQGENSQTFMYPSGTFSPSIGGFGIGYYKNITNLKFVPQHAPPYPTTVCSRVGYTFNITTVIFDKLLNKYETFTFPINYPPN